MKTNYAIIHTYTSTNLVEREQAKLAASKAIYRELVKITQQKSDKQTA